MIDICKAAAWLHNAPYSRMVAALKKRLELLIIERFGMPENINSGATGKSDLWVSYDQITATLSFIMSWAVLAPMAIIFSGKFLNQWLGTNFYIIDDGDSPNDNIKIKIPGIMTLTALKSELYFGFALFIILLFLIGMCCGKSAYRYFVAQFGIDPGQWNAICVLSAFLSVLLSFSAFLVYRFFFQLRGDINVKRDEVISKLMQREN